MRQAPKLPALCPACGVPPQEYTKRWSRQRFPWGKIVRYPVAVIATYHCGAKVQARFVVKPGLSGRHGGARWLVEAVAGCMTALEDALTRQFGDGMLT